MGSESKPHSEYLAAFRDWAMIDGYPDDTVWDIERKYARSLFEQLAAAHEALTACGDVLFAPWDDDEARRAASRRAEALTSAVLFGPRERSS